MSLLSLSGVSLTLSGRAVLTDVTMAVAAGECVGLIGPNGAGKTSLMRAALGLVPATGDIRLGGAAVATLSARARAAAVAWLPQAREVAWPMPVEDLVALGRLPSRARVASLAGADREAVEAALSGLDLHHLRTRRATELSGGELARALIARALAQDAPLVLADEPAAGLDPAHQIGVMETLRAAADGGRGVLVSLHDLSLAARWCDRLVLMRGGRVAADAAPEAVLTPQRLAEAFGIEAHIEATAEGLIVQPVRRLAS